MNTVKEIRTSPIAGSWYSANPATLTKEISGYIDNAKNPSIEGRIDGLISPHAGYYYSGETAGHAYRCVQDKSFDLCVVVSPLHAYLPYPLLSTAHAAYATPLGRVEVAQDLVAQLNQQLAEESLPGLQLVANDQEHSLEIQLPFLQIALSQPFQLLPIMVRTNNPVLLQKTAVLLAELIKNQKALVVASTDLSHFYDEETANRFDRVILKCMTDFSPEGVLEAELNEEGFACGSGAVALSLWTTQFLGAKKVTLLKHSTSAKSSGDTSSVVGYGALVITG